MVVACPKCSARYRVDRAQIGPDGARLRCAKCQAVFRVRTPEAEPVPRDIPAALPPSPQTATAPEPSVQQSPPPPEPAPEAAPPRPEPQLDRERMVLVADSDVEMAKSTAAALSSWGLQPVLVHDGVEALLTIQRMLPQAVVLDAGLPKMYGFQICEMLKRNESLRHIKVILVGTIYHKGRYHRPPSELYGADVYLEQPDLPDGLIPFMTQFGFDVNVSSTAGSEPTPPEPMATEPPSVSPSPALDSPASPDPVTAAPPEFPAPAPSPLSAPAPPAPTAPAPPPVVSEPEVASDAVAVAPPVPEVTAPPAPAPAADDEFAEERAMAERLARIIVSDIVLYQPDKFQAAVFAGNVVEAMDSSLDEGRSLFSQRIDARVRDEKDYLVEELLRVARERGMQ